VPAIYLPNGGDGKGEAEDKVLSYTDYGSDDNETRRRR
jgi:hypothetical protein